MVTSGPYIKPPVAHEWRLENNAWFYNKDGRLLKNEWLFYNNNWYHFNDKGVMETNWVYYNDKWYHMDTDGKMQTGWIYDANKWYHLNNDGSMNRNAWIDGTYFVGGDGAMLVDTTTPDGYKVGKDGKWIPTYVTTSNNSNQPSTIYTDGETIKIVDNFEFSKILKADNFTVTNILYKTVNGLGKSGKIKRNDYTPKINVYADNMNLDPYDAKEDKNGDYILKDRRIRAIKEYDRPNKTKDDDGKSYKFALGNGKYAHARFENNMPVFDTKLIFKGNIHIRSDARVIFNDGAEYKEIDYYDLVEKENYPFEVSKLETAVIAGLDDKGYVTDIFIDTIN